MLSRSHTLPMKSAPQICRWVRVRTMYRFNTAGMVSRVASQEGFEKAGGRTADPSTSLRFGRDDKGRGVTQVGVVAGWVFEKHFQE